MKKVIAFAAVIALSATLAGCAAPAASSSSASATSSSEAVAVSSAASESASSSAASTVNWTKAASAEEAAKGAGFKTFGVMKTIKADDVTFKSPTFAYAGGVAQALYENGAAQIDVRKADGKHDAPLTDRDKTEFASSWNKNDSGLDVTCYGSAKGAATVITWTDGTKEYGVTYQGTGGDELTLDSDEVAAIVKGIKEADGDKKKDEEKSESSEAAASDESADNNADVPQFDMETAVFNAGLGEFLSYSRVQGEDGVWYWAVVTRGADGNEATSYLDDAGNVIQGGIDVAGADSERDEVEKAVWDNGLGELQSYQSVQGEDGNWYTRIVTRGADGNEATSYLDANGNVVQGGIEEADEQSDVEQAVWNNGLGQLDHYESVQGTDGNWYTRVTTRGADGGEYTSYLDSNGNVVQGGIEEAQ